MSITVKKLYSGYYHIRGIGPCNWAQPPIWPCDEVMIRQCVFPEASEKFILECIEAAQIKSEWVNLLPWKEKYTEGGRI